MQTNKVFLTHQQYDLYAKNLFENAIRKILI